MGPTSPSLEGPRALSTISAQRSETSDAAARRTSGSPGLGTPRPSGCRCRTDARADRRPGRPGQRRWLPKHSRINCVAPAGVETAELRDSVSPRKRAAIAGNVPQDRLGRPANITEAIAFLVSDRSSWITGTTLDITGGRTL